MDWSDIKEKRLFKKFFEKTGIQLVNEPIYYSKWEEDNVEELGMEAQIRPASAIPKLEKAILAHPEIPSLKNYLYVAYMYTDRIDKAEAILEQTLKEHPNYVFGITNIILRANDKEAVLKVGHLLKEPRDIREFEGYDGKPIHISAFKNYQHAAAHYETLIGENDSAVERLETLMELGLDQEYLDLVAKDLALCRIEVMQERLKGRTDKERNVLIKQKVYLTEYVNADTPLPNLTHQELAVFYKQSTEKLNKQQQKEIFDLPRTSLIADLEKIVEDSMKRWVDLEATDYEEDTHEFTLHALYFLSALKAEDSLQKVLNLLRMGEEFTDYWFGDWIEDIFHPTLYALGEGQLDQLQAFAVEENIKNFNKILVCWVVSQVALHQPHRRAEVVQWYQTVFQTFLDNPDNEDLIDTTFLSFAIVQVVNFRGIELLPLIEQLFALEWIHDNVGGDLEEVTRLLKEEPHPSELEPFPENIHEYYSKEYLKRKVKPPHSPELEAVMARMESKAEKLITKFWSKRLFDGLRDLDDYDDDVFFDGFDDDYYEPIPVKTIVREGPKIGRNDPCPCGSGKKYKKCCLRK